jgi:hypothetical protein
MSKNRFEQLIEYVINDEDAKAKELFHQIVVEKSRQIYENLMQEEDLDEDNAMGEEPTEIDTDMDEGHDMMGGSQTADLIDDVEAEESGMQEGEDDSEFDDEEGDEEGGTNPFASTDDNEGGNGGDEPATKDDVLNLEDKLDQLMAEFENMMDPDSATMMGPETVDDDEFETEGMMENITLKQVHPKTTTQEEGNGKSGPVAFNSGAAGMASKPVRMTGDTAQGRTAPTAKDMIGKVGNSPSQSTQAPKAATKPHTAQATGVNTKSPLPGGRRG